VHQRTRPQLIAGKGVALAVSSIEFVDDKPRDLPLLRVL
jgi:hypothetical protein